MIYGGSGNAAKSFLSSTTPFLPVSRGWWGRYRDSERECVAWWVARGVAEGDAWLLLRSGLDAYAFAAANRV